MQNKKIFIEIPTWLGDCVMTTPAIENIVKTYTNCKLVIFGSFVSTRIFLNHPNLHRIVIDDSKKEGFRYTNLFKIAKTIQGIDIAISFRRNFTTKFLFFFIKAKEKYIYKRYTKKQIHQVIRYNDFINKSINISSKADDLKIYIKKENSKKDKLILGINPGATYGSAKRWYAKEFAKVAINMNNRYDIIIFGGPNEIDIAHDIQKELEVNNITNFKNFAGQTSVEELIEHISNTDLFITGDSGPMHLAATFKIPSICIFGPTKDIETSQWNNTYSKIIKKDYDCMPCMKRVCPLDGKENHQCMKNIKADEVISAVKSLLEI